MSIRGRALANRTSSLYLESGEGSKQRGETRAVISACVRNPHRSVCKLWDAKAEEEARLAAVGRAQNREVLYVVHLEIEDNFVRIISARPVTKRELKRYEKYE